MGIDYGGMNWKPELSGYRFPEMGLQKPRKRRKTRPDDWRILGFGKYRYLTLPKLILTDIDYFYAQYRKKGFWNPGLSAQADQLVALASHVLPPFGDEDCRFWIRADDNGALSGITLLGHSKRAPDIKTTSHLDLAIFGRCSYRQHSSDILMRWFKEKYFGNANVRLESFRCEAFFSNPRHFAVGCQVNHNQRSLLSR
jgi:hypothetical protein